MQNYRVKQYENKKYLPYIVGTSEAHFTYSLANFSSIHREFETLSHKKNKIILYFHS